ncbi:PAS domain-containing sensor histidine kinase [Sulfitobacter sp.]|uniref:PAS domain-containing sensor histidine kinase n=1 Tax=Sulfitobacter sp. TaxID=1903071 RepID=UPI00329706BB
MSQSESQQIIFESDTAPLVPTSATTVPSIDRVVSLMPGFVYVFNHLTFSNDYTNRSVAQHLGYSSAEIKHFGDAMLAHLVHEDDQPLLGAHMQKIAGLEDNQTAVLEYRVKTKWGAVRWLRSVDRVFDRAPDGKVLRHIGCASDFTAEKEAEIALSKLNAGLEDKVAMRTRDLAELNEGLEQRINLRTRELEDTVDELEQLTFVATHDLKVPANNLSRLSRMLGEKIGVLPDQQAELVSWINTSAEQLQQKIQGLVLVAQLRLSNELPCLRLNLARQVQVAIEDLEKAMPGKRLPVVCDIPDHLEVEFSKFELGCILTSLLDNAVKYAALRPLRITIRGRVEEGRVVLTVADNGVGVDGERESAKVFGLFQRAHKTPAGSGISLYCDQRMLQRRGGDLSVSGARGAGAEFKIVFPVVGENNDAD